MEQNIFAIKFGKSIVIGYEENGQKKIIKDKEQNSLFNYLISIDNNVEINIYEIIKFINEDKIGKIGEDINLTNVDEIYRVEYIKSGKTFLFEQLLVKLFEKIKGIINTFTNKELIKAINIHNNFKNDLILIIHRAAIISKIRIINFIDLNKSILFYLSYSNKISKENRTSLIKIDDKIEISIFKNEEHKRTFNSLLRKSEFDLKKINLNEELNEIVNKEDFEYLKAFINKLFIKTHSSEEMIDQIFIFNNSEKEFLNEISIFGALYSYLFPISKECLLILNFLDYEENYPNYPIKKLTIFKKIYEIKQKILEINIDDIDIPFENCYYKNIKILFFKDILNQTENIITIYYNQQNVFYCTKDINIATSAEFIFFKTFPKININDKYKIDIVEKFEENQLFKRINILNVDRGKIKLDNKELEFYDALEPLNTTSYKIDEEMLYPDTLFLVGQNLNVLSFFSKDMFYELSIIKEINKTKILNFFKNMELIEKDYSFNNLLKNKENLLNMVKYINNSYNKRIIDNYQCGNVKNFNENDANILIKYGNYQLFEKVFYINYKLELNEINYNKYKKVIDSLNLFFNKCKKVEKDFFQLSKLYNAACTFLLDYIEISNKTNEDIIFDLIEFEKDNIYKDANENNLNLILNLTKNSFLYPYFLQFNSSFNISGTLLEEDNKYVEACKTSMITLNQIKLDLIKSLPKYGIRICSNVDYLATTKLNIDITIYNEKKIFGHFLTPKELEINNDIHYNKRVKISFLQKHERFAHYKKYLNKSEKNFMTSPRGIINYNNDKVFILASKNNNKKGEFGETLEFIITNGNRYLIDKIFKLDEKVDLKELYNINLFLESNNDNIIKELEKLPNPNKDNGNIEENKNFEKEKEKSESYIIKKKKLDFDNNICIKDEIEKNKNEDDEFERRKVEMISANPIRKYTFERNTIQEYKLINGKLIPVNNNG